MFAGKKTPQQAMDDAVQARQRDPAPVREAEHRASTDSRPAGLARRRQQPTSQQRWRDTRRSRA